MTPQKSGISSVIAQTQTHVHRPTSTQKLLANSMHS